MREKNLVYINVALLIILIVIAVSFMGLVRPSRNAAGERETPAPPEVSVKQERAVYQIEETKLTARRMSGEQPQDMEAVFKNFPEEDVGPDIVTAWAGVNPEDKAKFIEGLDRKIKSCRKALKSDPDDKKARNVLAMSETIRKLVAKEFRYKSADRR